MQIHYILFSYPPSPTAGVSIPQTRALPRSAAHMSKNPNGQLKKRPANSDSRKPASANVSSAHKRGVTALMLWAIIDGRAIRCDKHTIDCINLAYAEPCKPAFLPLQIINNHYICIVPRGVAQVTEEEKCIMGPESFSRNIKLPSVDVHLQIISMS